MASSTPEVRQDQDGEGSVAVNGGKNRWGVIGSNTSNGHKGEPALMDYQPKAHARQPFPWLGIGLAVAVALGVEAFIVYEVLSLFDCDLLDT